MINKTSQLKSYKTNHFYFFFHKLILSPMKYASITFNSFISGCVINMCFDFIVLKLGTKRIHNL